MRFLATTTNDKMSEFVVAPWSQQRRARASRDHRAGDGFDMLIRHVDLLVANQEIATTAPYAHFAL